MERTLTAMKVGDRGIVTRLTHPGPIRRRLIDVGFSAGTVISCLGKSPLGDPIAYAVKGTVIALRQEDAEQIYIKEEATVWD